MSKMSELALEIEEQAMMDVISGEDSSSKYSGMFAEFYNMKRIEFELDYINHVEMMAETYKPTF